MSTCFVSFALCNVVFAVPDRIPIGERNSPVDFAAIWHAHLDRNPCLDIKLDNGNVLRVSCKESRGRILVSPNVVLIDECGFEIWWAIGSQAELRCDAQTRRLVLTVRDANLLDRRNGSEAHFPERTWTFKFLDGCDK